MIELSERTVARLTVLANERGVTPDVIVDELVAARLPDVRFDHQPDEAFRKRITESIIEHREILDALAAT